MMNILWSQFEVNQQAKDISFEGFCFQIAYIKYHELGYFDNFFNTAGSEFYLSLHTECKELNLGANEKIGWQAKWWYNSEDNTSLTSERRDQLINNFKTTLKRHPDIKLWIICTPGSFDEDSFNKLLLELKKLSNATNFIHWSKEKFKNFLAADYSKFGSIFHHHFNSTFVSFDFVKEYTERQIHYLHNKFDTDLYVPSEYDDKILHLLNYANLYKELELRSSYIHDDIAWVKKRIEKRDLESFLDAKYANSVLELVDFIYKTLEKLSEILASNLNIEKCKILNHIIFDYLKEYRKYTDDLNRTISEGRWPKDEDQSKYEWRHRDLIDDIHTLHSHIVKTELNENSIHNFRTKPISISELLEPVFQKEIHILSSAGYGKTNIACNIAKVTLEKNVPVILLLGSNFRKTELPQKIIIELLGIDKEYTFKQLLNALNTLGFLKGFKIPIIIDGLNESKPYKEIWQTHLYDVIAEINKLDYVCLITTCRDRYISSIFEKENIFDIKNTFILEGLTDKQKNSAIPKYFIKYSITPTSLNFNKDLFKHPLLLKIFCEANEGRKNTNISIDSIFGSIDVYYDKIIEKATDNDILLKRKVNQRISQLCEKLWKDNNRDIDIADFVSIISPNSETLSDTIADKILDEGLCLFQRNLDNSNIERIQFAYDLVAGYLIASKVLLPNAIPKEQLQESLKERDVQIKLFEKENNHPLAEDVMISLLYLLSSKCEAELFEIFPNDVTHEIACRNIDYYIGNISGQEKIKKLHTDTSMDNPNYKLLFSKLYENIFQKNVHGLTIFTMSILIELTQIELDIYWTEIIRKNNSTTYDILEKIKKAASRRVITTSEIEEYLYISICCTVSTNQAIRNLATENLYLIGRTNPEQLLNCSYEGLRLNDENTKESIIGSICGTVLVARNKQLTETVLKFIVTDFLPKWKNTHIGIIDYILTLVEFALYNFDVDYKKEINFDKHRFTVAENNKKSQHSEKHSRYSSFLTGVDMYDFIKHQIASISTNTYIQRYTFPEDKSIEIILNRVKEKGYSDELFSQINKDFSEDRNYRYGRGSQIKYYSEKYLWQAYFEFVGYLFLDGKLSSEDEYGYRCSYIFYDPTFPKLPRRIQLVADCFFPAANEDIQKWIDNNNQNFIDDYYVHSLFTNSNWVLLSASINQKGEANDTQFSLYITTFLTSKENIGKFERGIKNDSYHLNDSDYFTHIYAGEISWSRFILTEGKTYDEERYNLIKLPWEYRWNSWSNYRYTNPDFPFLNATIANTYGLTFHVEDLSFYNSMNEPVTKIVWSESSQFYYIRKDILDQITAKEKMDMVWYQLVSKYGEYGKFVDSTLKPSFKDLRRLVRYEEFSNRCP